jgi:dGTPase
MLASYAVTEEQSRGREYSEAPHAYRAAFERDRDRIIHSSAFRRLEGKTQVFTPGLDDYYRTRLTHSIEVAQIGRTIARALGLNEDLTEAVCLAHDLGHAPFGHTGEAVLNGLLADAGGFEHNQQTLRIVTRLEHPYPAFMGLNLMYETRLSLAKHSSPYDHPAGVRIWDEKNCPLEGQIADLADRIAYNCHDLEDGQKARLIDREQLQLIPIFTRAQAQVKAETIDDWTIRRTRTSKAIINRLVGDCIKTSRAAIDRVGIKTLSDVLGQADVLIQLSQECDTELAVLERFLLNHFYHHERLLETAKQVKQWLSQLFSVICTDPMLMPSYFQGFIQSHGLQRAVADYIAGMTDGFCLKTLEKIG